VITAKEAYAKAMAAREAETQRARRELTQALDRAVKRRIEEGRLTLTFTVTSAFVPAYLDVTEQWFKWVEAVALEGMPGVKVSTHQRNTITLDWSNPT